MRNVRAYVKNKPHKSQRGLCGSISYQRRLRFFLNSNLAAIVSACRAYCMINVELATVGANCQCRSHSLVMSSSLQRPCFGLSSFRMCHFLLIFYCVIIFSVVSTFPTWGLWGVPAPPALSARHTVRLRAHGGWVSAVQQIRIYSTKHPHLRLHQTA